MDSESIFTFTSPTHVDRVLSSSALPVVDDIPQREGKPGVVEIRGEVRLIHPPIPSYSLNIR